MFEEAAVSIYGDDDSGYPESRLYDRDISLYWKQTGTVPVNFTVTGCSGEANEVGFLAIEKHNFDGQPIDWQYSSDNFVLDINNAVEQWDPGSGQTVKTLSTGVIENSWRIKASGEITNPQCSEVYMSKGLELRVRFDEKPLAFDKANVTWQETIGGIERSTKTGSKRRMREYAIFLDENDSEITNFRTAMADLDDYSKSFYIKDHEGDYWMCRLLEEPVEQFLTEGQVLMTIKVIEKL